LPVRDNSTETWLVKQKLSAECSVIYFVGCDLLCTYRFEIKVKRKFFFMKRPKTVRSIVKILVAELCWRQN